MSKHGSSVGLPSLKVGCRVASASRLLRYFGVVWVLSLGAGLAMADVRLARAFGDNMVLQADQPVVIWGYADADENVQVTIDRMTKQTVVDTSEQWRVEFPPLAATNTPIAFRVVGANTIELTNVAVGEVWLAAGQSNMQWPLAKSSGAGQAIRNATNPNLRLYSLRAAAHPGGGAFDKRELARLAPQDYLTGDWQVCSPESSGPFSAVAYYFGKHLQEKLRTPVGVICSAVGGTPTESWIRRKALRKSPQLAPLVAANWIENPLQGAWCRQRAKENLAWTTAGNDQVLGDELGPYHPFRPGYMWEAGAAIFSPMGVRGVVWYQGESNAESARLVAQHQQLFETLVKDWRAQFDRDDLPFLFVQLPALGRPHWPAFRQSQLDCLRELDNAGMAATIDLGHPTNVHPSDKRPVGDRLAQLALGQVYERLPAAESTSPIAVGAELDGRQAWVTFDDGQVELISRDDAPLRHFEVAGADHTYRAADARVEVNRIVVSSSAVATPRFVRYAWRPFPAPPVNFFNAAGLPAAPFELRVVADESNE